MSLTDRVLDALATAIQLEARVTTMANNVADLAREVREMDRRLIRIETVVELTKSPGSPDARPRRLGNNPAGS